MAFGQSGPLERADVAAAEEGLNQSAPRRSATYHLRDKTILRLSMLFLPTCWKSTAPIRGMAGAIDPSAAHNKPQDENNEPH